MKRLLTFVAPTLALLLAGSGARADLLSPVNNIAWTYNFTPSTNSLSADGGGTGGVSFTNEPTKNAVGNSDIVATNLRVFSTASAGTPDSIAAGHYSFSLVVTDSASGQSKTLTFGGILSGTFSANNSDLMNTFSSPTTWTGTLGNNTYTVTMTSYTPPGPPAASNAGSISAHVTVAPTSVHTAQTPEPSALVLSFLGASFAGFTSWRKRRQAKAAA